MITLKDKKDAAAEYCKKRIMHVLDLKFQKNITKAITHYIAHKHIVIAIEVIPTFVPAVLKLSEEIGAACGIPTPRVYRYRQAVCIDIPLPDKVHDIVEPEDVSEGLTMNDLCVPLGVVNTGHIAYLDFSNPVTAHVLVSGKTGSGKSTLVKWMIEALMRKHDPEGIKFVFIDLDDGGDFDPFVNSPYNLHEGILTDFDEADIALSYIEKEAQRRAKLKTRDHMPIFVFLDEAQILLGKTGYPKRFSRFASTYRKRNMHLVTITQDPIEKNLGDLGIKKNSAMIAGRMGGSRAAASALDLAKTGANTLVGNGDFLMIDVDGIRRFTGVYLEDSDIDHGQATEFDIGLAQELAELDAEPKGTYLKDYNITPEDMEIVRNNYERVSLRELGRMLARGDSKERSFNAVKRIVELVKLEEREQNYE